VAAPLLSGTPKIIRLMRATSPGHSFDFQFFSLQHHNKNDDKQYQKLDENLIEI
jgi:hypothetical protein